MVAADLLLMDRYRTEASLYAVVSSPMMVGTDIRLMTVPTPTPF